MKHARLLLAPLFLLSGLPHRPVRSAPATFAIRAETLLTVAGPPVRDGVVLVRGGKIISVGAGVPVPRGATLLLAKVAMPGLVDAHSYLGCQRETEERVDAITPELRICDGFDPDAQLLARARRAGVTAAAIAPGNGNAIGGQISVVRLGPRPSILVPYAGQKLSVSVDATSSQRNPTSRAGLVELVRSALQGARSGQAVSSTAQTELLAGGVPTALSERPRALQPLLRRKVPALIHAPSADDAENALALLAEFRLRGALLHTSGDVADLRRAVPVVLGPLRYADSERTLSSAGRLAEAGVPVAFCTDAPLGDPGSLRLTAHLAVKHGMTPAAALRALTLEPARLFGIERRLGSLAPGRDADLLLLSGDPLDLTSRVQAVIVNGTVAYRAIEPPRRQERQED